MERKCNFTDLVLAVKYSIYANNFNMIGENIEFEDINLKDSWGVCLYYIGMFVNRIVIVL
jgi:hypothetical protein